MVNLPMTHCYYYSNLLRCDTCKRYKIPDDKDPSAYLFYVSRPDIINGECEMYIDKRKAEDL